jgi:hypothetical protein
MLSFFIVPSAANESVSDMGRVFEFVSVLGLFGYL